MPKPRTQPHALPVIQLAAGGLVWRQIQQARCLAVVHRPKYDDWSLPKGKPEPGEELAETARREVDEEVGCEVRFLDFAGVVHYPLRENRTKVVLFWNMEATGPSRFRPNAEIDEVAWLPPDQALRRLTYAVEQDLLRTAGTPKGPVSPER